MKTLQAIVIAVLATTFTACSLDSADRSGKLTIRLSPTGSKVASFQRSSGMSFLGTPPASINAFSCIGINVMGPGIPDSSGNPKPDLPLLFDRLLRKESYCSYRGILRGPLLSSATTDQEISLLVPPGAPRLIQVIGIIEQGGSNDCDREFNPGVPPVLDGNGIPIEGEAYELGRAVVDLFQDQTVSIAMDYDTFTTDAERTARLVQCGGGGGGGNGLTILAPVNLVMPSASPVHLATGPDHLCGIFGGSNTVHCRGANTFGQLGDGTAVDKTSFVPTSITGATQLALGNGFTCALLSGGNVTCWGKGGSGQLGNGAATNSTTPVSVSGLGSVVEIAAGGAHACGRNSGGVYCWGLNSSGQIGDGTTTNVSAPVLALSGTGASLSAGLSHTCAGNSGAVKCWGNGVYSQVGLGAGTPSLTPVMVSGSSTASSVSAGQNQNCLIIGTTLSCWGDNSLGQVGVGSGTSVIALPSVVSVASVAEVGSGVGYSCALASGGSLYCWGIGPLLGTGTTSGSNSPVLVSSLGAGVTGIYPGSVSGTVCVGVTGGNVWCWGDNSFSKISP